MVRTYVGDQNPSNYNDEAQAEKTGSIWGDYWESWNMAGGYGNDTLIGGMERDTLHGGLGNDYLRGGKGSDTYYIDSYSDVIVEYDGQGTDAVYSRVSHTLGNAVENLYLIPDDRAAAANGNAKNNYIQGNDRNNVLYGAGGNDTLKGESGNDILIGTFPGANDRDSLYGGSGSDKFYLGHKGAVYYSSNGYGDFAQIADFEYGTDKLQLAGSYSNYSISSGSNHSELKYNGDPIAIFSNISGAQLHHMINQADYV